MSCLSHPSDPSNVDQEVEEESTNGLRMKKVMRLHSAISPASARALGGEGSPEIDFNPRNLLSTIFQVSTSRGEDCLFDTSHVLSTPDKGGSNKMEHVK